jgi:phospholipid/cholesterol/gamma-HCH transport system substrate-binding protein
MSDKEDPRFRHLTKKIGGFAILALLLIAGVVLLIGREKDLFTQKYELRFTTQKGTGFTRGMPVKLSGFRIGKVKSIALNEAATVDVVVQIDRKYQKWIRKDSEARLVKEGLVGDQIVEISVGSPAAPELKAGDTLACVKTKGLDELADEIAERIKPVLTEVKDIIGYVNDPKGDIKQSLRNISLLTKNLETTRQHTDALLVKAGEGVGGVSGKAGAVLDKSGEVIDKTGEVVKKLDVSLARVNEKLPRLLENVDKTLVHVEKITRDVKGTGEKVFPRVPTLVKGSEEALEESNSVIRAVKDVWPLRSHVTAPPEKQFVPGDSHE